MSSKHVTLNRFHHVGIVVKNISEAIDKYAAALGVDKDKVVVEVMSYMTGKGEMEEFKYTFLALAEERFSGMIYGEG